MSFFEGVFHLIRSFRRRFHGLVSDVDAILETGSVFGSYPDNLSGHLDHDHHRYSWVEALQFEPIDHLRLKVDDLVVVAHR